MIKLKNSKVNKLLGIILLGACSTGLLMGCGDTKSANTTGEDAAETVEFVEDEETTTDEADEKDEEKEDKSNEDSKKESEEKDNTDEADDYQIEGPVGQNSVAYTVEPFDDVTTFIYDAVIVDTTYSEQLLKQFCDVKSDFKAYLDPEGRDSITYADIVALAKEKSDKDKLEVIFHDFDNDGECEILVGTNVPAFSGGYLIDYRGGDFYVNIQGNGAKVMLTYTDYDDGCYLVLGDATGSDGVTYQLIRYDGNGDIVYKFPSQYGTGLPSGEKIYERNEAFNNGLMEEAVKKYKETFQST